MTLKQNYLRKIPAVNRLLQRDEIKDLLQDFPQDLVVDLINQVLNEIRQNILQGTIDPTQLDLSEEGLAREAQDVVLRYMAPRLKKVINTTGTVLHTNLGRAVLSERAAEALGQIARTYSNLEFDLEEGQRGSRYTLVTDLLCRLTGAEDAMVVNNNAAAVLLVLSTLAAGKEVILSRGEMVEIGGSFRMHEVMKASGCKLVEVGSTNKTHLFDYEDVLSDETGLIVKCHTSNYHIVGFHKAVTGEELAELGRLHQIPVYEDLGSGVLIGMEKYGITHEPTVQEAVQAGLDVVTFSGDKLLGGPQAGIIVGHKDIINRLKRNHLTRALRVDKFTLAALEVTLKHYLKEDEAMEEIPTLRMLKATSAQIKEREAVFAQRIQTEIPGTEVQIIAGTSMVGGGSLPLEKIPTYLLAIKLPGISTSDASILLRKGKIPVVCRIQEDELIFDFRTLLPGEEEELLMAIKAIIKV